MKFLCGAFAVFATTFASAPLGTNALNLQMLTSRRLLEGEEHPFEYAGLYETEVDGNKVFLVIQKKNDAYAESSMKVALFSSGDADEHVIEEKEKDAEGILEGSCLDATGSASIGGANLTANGFCYNLVFDADSFQTVFEIDVTGADHLLMYAEHDVAEFENGVHHLKNVDNDDIEALHTNQEHDEEEPAPAKIELVFGATMVTTICTLIGAVLILPMTKGWCVSGAALQQVGGSFSSGVLLATTAFLLIPEGFQGLSGASENTKLAQFGAALIGGYVTCALLHMSIHACRKAHASPEVAPKNESELTDVETLDKNAPAELPKKKCSEWGSLVWSILLGDALHNIADGIAIGTAFKSCGVAYGWIVVAGAVSHEVTQELSDFILLTTKGGMKPSIALFFNFLSGCTSVIAGLIAFTAETSNTTQGIMMIYSAGTFLWIVCSETFPTVVEAKSWKDVFVVLTLFILGATTIGLVLISHTHCDVGHGAESVGHGAESESGSHDGHDHGRRRLFR